MYWAVNCMSPVGLTPPGMVSKSMMAALAHDVASEAGESITKRNKTTFRRLGKSLNGALGGWMVAFDRKDWHFYRNSM